MPPNRRHQESRGQTDGVCADCADGLILHWIGRSVPTSALPARSCVEGPSISGRRELLLAWILRLLAWILRLSCNTRIWNWLRRLRQIASHSADIFRIGQRHISTLLMPPCFLRYVFRSC